MIVHELAHELLHRGNRCGQTTHTCAKPRRKRSPSWCVARSGLTRTQRRLTISSFIPVTRRRWLNRCPLFRKAAGKILTGVLPRDGADH